MRVVLAGGRPGARVARTGACAVVRVRHFVAALVVCFAKRDRNVVHRRTGSVWALAFA